MLDFEFTDEHRALKDLARKSAENEIRPKVE
jgi:hypothetical protein